MTSFVLLRSAAMAMKDFTTVGLVRQEIVRIVQKKTTIKVLKWLEKNGKWNSGEENFIVRGKN